jgi:sigma-B regulation protein RsbU (phosphoserine phosphatase)
MMRILVAEDDRATLMRIQASLLSVHLGRLLTRLDGNGSMVRRWCNTEERYEAVPPAEVAATLNRRFACDEDNQQFFTVVYGILDLANRTFCYTSAGHPGPLTISAGGSRVHRARPPAIGFLPEGAFTEQSLPFAPGDRIYFYTDWIFEVSDADGSEFGQERMREILEGAAGESLEASLRQVVEAARAWSASRTFEDDVSLIGVEIR